MRSVVGAGCICALSYYSYHRWRNSEISSIRQDALKLAKTGFVVLDSPVSPTEKRKAWKGLSKVLMEHWQSKYQGMTVSNSDTWPQPENGKLYDLSCTNNQVPNMPKLTTDNYKVQAIVSYLIDPSLKNVHYGGNSHPKLLALVNPFYLLVGGIDNSRRLRHWLHTRESVRKVKLFLTPTASHDENEVPVSSAIELNGSDQSWHLVNLPNLRYAIEGEIIPAGAHIDAGENNVYMESGMPAMSPGVDVDVDGEPDDPSSSKTNAQLQAQDTLEVLTLEDRFLLMMMHQLAILFHCETPGDLEIEHGATSIYPYSHLMLLKAIGDLQTVGSSACVGGRVGAASSDLPDRSSQGVSFGLEDELLRHSLALGGSNSTGTVDAVSPIDKADNSTTTAAPGAPSTALPWSNHRDAMKGTGDECKEYAVAVPIPETKQVLVHGLLMHAATWSTSLMTDHDDRSGIVTGSSSNIRVIQNSKQKCAAITRGSHARQLALLKAIPSDSLLRVLARGCVDEWIEVLGLSEDDLNAVAVMSGHYRRLVADQQSGHQDNAADIAALVSLLKEI